MMLSRFTSMLLLAAASLTLTADLQAKAIYVATNGLHTVADNWTTAYTNLQKAIDEAVAGDTLYVAGHSFAIGSQLNWNQKGIAIEGGYAATNNAGLPGERDPYLFPTVLARPASVTNRIFTVTGVENGTLSGVRMCNGLVSQNIGGAGLLIVDCTNLLIDHCVIESNAVVLTINNAGNLYGGGMTASNSVMLITNTVFQYNRTETSQGSTASHANGGGLTILGGTVAVSDCLFDQNYLIAARNSFGAGIYVFGGVHEIRNSVLSRNWSYLPQGGLSYGRGDGLHVGGTTTVVDFFNSIASGNMRDGLHLEGGTLRVTHGTVTVNGQNGIRRVAGSLAVTNSIIYRNVNDVSGAAVLGFSLVGNAALAGTNGVISADPLFERGLYLASTSPAVNAGSGGVGDWGLGGRVTAADGSPDADAADLGAHFRTGPAASAAEAAVLFDSAAADLYVAPEGDDGNVGTLAFPFRSATRALAAASSGSRIHVAMGLYTNKIESFPLAIRKHGIQILGTNAAETVFRATGSGARVLDVWGVSGLAVEGVTLTGGAGDTAAYFQSLTPINFLGHRGAGGIQAGYSSLAMTDVVVSNNTVLGRVNEHISGGGIQGLSAFAALTRVRVENNRFLGSQSNTGDGYGGGLFLVDGQWVLDDCVVLNNSASFGNNGGNYGGGLYLDGGNHRILRTTIVSNQVAGQGGALRRGGGVYLVNGALEQCVIARNGMSASTSADSKGGGVYQSGGLLRNCLVNANNALRDGGGLFATAGTNENLTVSGNTVNEAGGVAGASLSGTAAATNGIFAGNIRLFDAKEDNLSATGGSVGYSAMQPLRPGPGNTDAEVAFMNASADDYRPRPGSGSIDAGFQLDWMAAGTDLGGQARIQNSVPDMGAFETQPLNEGPLRINFIASQRDGKDGLSVTFTAYAAGSNTTSLYYKWDFDGDGNAEQEGSGLSSVVRLFGRGFHTIGLTVSNGAAETETLLKPDYIRVYLSALYVWSGGDGSSGTNWPTAFPALALALPYVSASSTVYLAGETMAITSTVTLSGLANVTFEGGYEATNTLAGLGPRDPAAWPTVIRRNLAAGNFRLMYISRVTDCRLSGVTLADGYTTDLPASPVAPGSGAGIRMLLSSLEIENCVFTNNQARTSGNSYIWGGALLAQSSILSIRDTLFVGNIAYGGPVASANNRSLGGALAVDSCNLAVSNCRFIRNDADAGGNHQSWGGAIYTIGGTNLIRNTVIAFNRSCPNTKNSGLGGGIYMNAGTMVENCTVVSNQTRNPAVTASGDGIYQLGGSITNTIVYFNRNMMSNTVNDIRVQTPASIGYSCSPGLTHGENGNITTDPLLTDLVAAALVPRSGSPCRNAGLNLSWMQNATDLAGKTRILSGTVDMGAYEIAPPAGTLILVQ